jgi:hypothetical protein
MLSNFGTRFGNSCVSVLLLRGVSPSAIYQSGELPQSGHLRLLIQHGVLRNVMMP